MTHDRPPRHGRARRHPGLDPGARLARRHPAGRGGGGAELLTYLAAHVERRRREPADDLTTGLIKVQDEEGDRLSDNELRWILWSVIVAGHETTMHLIANAVVALCADPERHDRPSMLPPAACGTILRRCSVACLDGKVSANEPLRELLREKIPPGAPRPRR